MDSRYKSREDGEHFLAWDARSLEQGRFWQSNHGGIRLVSDLSEDHLHNLINYINSERYRFYVNEIKRIRVQLANYVQTDPMHTFMIARLREIKRQGPGGYAGASPLMRSLQRHLSNRMNDIKEAKT